MTYDAIVNAIDTRISYLENKRKYYKRLVNIREGGASKNAQALYEKCVEELDKLYKLAAPSSTTEGDKA